MKFTYNDGGRADAGFSGNAGDCVTRAVAIATQQPYQAVYDALSEGCRSQRVTKHAKRKGSARNGVHTTRKWFKDYMTRLGWKFTATMGIGTGCKVHLVDGELPMGRLIVSLSGHYTTVIDGVVHDIYDPQREVQVWTPERGHHVQRRCVYGYWSKA